MDWREDYIVCPHLSADAEISCRSNFRACCEECRDRGFLNLPIEDFVLITQGNLTIAKLEDQIFAVNIKDLEELVIICITAGCYKRATIFGGTVEGKPVADSGWYCDEHAPANRPHPLMENIIAQHFPRVTFEEDE